MTPSFRFVRVPTDLLFDAELSFQAKVVWAALYSFATWRDGPNRGLSFVGVKRLADDLHVSPDTVSRALAELARAGWIVRQERGARQRARTRVLLPDERVPAAEVVPQTCGLGAADLRHQNTTTSPQQEDDKTFSPSVGSLSATNGQATATADGNGGTSPFSLGEVVVGTATAPEDGTHIAKAPDREERAAAGSATGAEAQGTPTAPEDGIPDRQEVRDRMLAIGYEANPRRKGRKSVGEVLELLGVEACWRGLREVEGHRGLRNPAGRHYNAAEAWARDHQTGTLARQAMLQAQAARVLVSTDRWFIRELVQRDQERRASGRPEANVIGEVKPPFDIGTALTQEQQTAAKDTFGAWYDRALLVIAADPHPTGTAKSWFVREKPLTVAELEQHVRDRAALNGVSLEGQGRVQAAR